MIEKFLNKVFGFSRVIAAFAVLICIITLVGSALYFLFSGSKGLSEPDFDEFIESMENMDSDSETGESSASDLDERRAFEKKYGDDIQDILELAEIEKKYHEEYYDYMIGHTMELDEDHRGPFVKGLKSFIKDGVKYIEKQKEPEFDNEDLFEIYDDLFEDAVYAAEDSKLESKAKRTAALGVMGSALTAMLLFLALPLLLQIEINTRKDSTPKNSQESE